MSDSVLTGLCPLIPIPLLDDWTRDLLRRRLVARLAAVAGTALTNTDAGILACGYRPPGTSGCAGGCLQALLIQPAVFLSSLVFRKLMRKILFFLTVKDAVDTFSQTFHEAFLLRHALLLGVLREPALVAPDPRSPDPHSAQSPSPDPRLLEVRSAVETVIRHTDTRPVRSLARSVFAGSRRLAAGSARRMTRVLRRWRSAGEVELSRRLEREAEAGLGVLIDELTRDLERRGGYLEQLEAALETRLGTTAAPPTTALPAPRSSDSTPDRPRPEDHSRRPGDS